MTRDSFLPRRGAAYVAFVIVAGLSVIALSAVDLTRHMLGPDGLKLTGQWLTLAGAQRLNWRSLLIGFVLFRIFDILKPPPVRQLERVPGGAGIVLDDMMAGVYGALVLYAAGWYFY